MLANQHQLPLFVYGTLMIGERNYIDILHQNVSRYESATVKGDLYYYRKEDYPALVKGAHEVQRQLFYVQNLETVLPSLDVIEGYYAEDDPRNMYDRKIVSVTTKSGEQKLAYTYMINPRLVKKQQKEFTLMNPKCWKTFRGR